MRDRLIDGLIQGDRYAWGAVAVLWVLTAVVVLIHRPGQGSSYTWLLFAVATAASLVGLPLSSAIAVPRVRWAPVEAPYLVAADAQAPANATEESWRRLRGPVVLVAGPDLGVPTVDASGRWVLAGVLSGKPVEGLPAAEPAPMKPGAPRLCLPSGQSCRPWPVAWPDPERPIPTGELGWGRAGAPAPLTTGEPSRKTASPAQPSRAEEALAYDVETGLYLFHVDPAPGATPEDPLLEVVGRVAGDVPRDSGIVFAIRKVAAGRIKALRLVYSGGRTAHEGAATLPAFAVERAEVSLTAGPLVFAWVVRPVLALTAVSLPVGVLALLLAPILHRSRLRRSTRNTPGESFTRREASAWIAPYLEAAAVLAAGLSAAAPAVVAIAALWGSR